MARATGEVSVIHLMDVTKTFDGGICALHNVSLEVEQGELVLLTGPSGAGKTTLLRTIFAAERPDQGQIVIAGRNICRLRQSSIPYLRRNIGVVFQDFKLLEERSALENVAIALEIRGTPRKRVRQRSLEALAEVGLSDQAKTKVQCLSGGEQQRVAIARAVVGSPAILLADEPTGNLDPERSRGILRLLAKVAAHGTTVIVATHDPMVVSESHFSRMVVLEQGAISEIQAGPMHVAPRPERAQTVDEQPLPVAARVVPSLVESMP